MARPTRLIIDSEALLHNIAFIKQVTQGKGVIAMVKANAYGCGVKNIVPVLKGKVDAFGVACLEEALIMRHLDSQTPCVVFQGPFAAEELPVFVQNQCATVVHTFQQLEWITQTALKKPLQVWVKVNTGMHRLGFEPEEIPKVVKILQNSPWVHKKMGIMTHFASADEKDNPATSAQLQVFQSLDKTAFSQQSLANSAAILQFPQTHADLVRPGIMLYGVSPIPNQEGRALGLMPVMHFVSSVFAIHAYSHPIAVGYGGTWKCDTPSVIGLVPTGYGDGYPRHVKGDPYVWIQGYQAPIAGLVSMDMMAVDLTHCPKVRLGDRVELWGNHIPVEQVAQWAGTSPYELICQTTDRARDYG
jgi:alanine racemase